MTAGIRGPASGRDRLRRLPAPGPVSFCVLRFRPVLELLEDRTLPSSGFALPSVHDLTSRNSFWSIQSAVDAARPGDVILVDAGTFAENVTIDKPLTLEGAQHGIPASLHQGPETILDAASNDGITPFYVRANDVTIDGFTVQNATNSNLLGFGILLGAGTSGANILNNIIQENIVGLGLANGPGGSQAVIQGNLFRNNNAPGAGSGTAIYTDKTIAGGTLAHVLINSNTFQGNQGTAAVTFGSLDPASPATDITLSGNTFQANSASLFAGVLTHSTIRGNTFEDSTQRQADITLFPWVNDLRITDNVLQNGAGSAIWISPYILGLGPSNVTLTDNSVSGYRRPGLDVPTFDPLSAPPVLGQQGDLLQAIHFNTSGIFPGWKFQVAYDSDSATAPVFEDLKPDANGNVILSHAYNTTAGLFLVTVKMTSGQNITVTNSFWVSILDGADDVDWSTVKVASVPPDGNLDPISTTTDSRTHLTTSIALAHSGTSQATVETLEYVKDPTNPSSPTSSQTNNTLWLDIRGKDISDGDMIQIQVSGIRQLLSQSQKAFPTIYYVDPETGQQVALSHLGSNPQGYYIYPDPTAADPTDTLTIVLKTRADHNLASHLVNLTGTVFVVNVSNTVPQSTTIAPPLASAGTAIDSGLRQSASFLSRTQLTVMLTASEDLPVTAPPPRASTTQGLGGSQNQVGAAEDDERKAQKEAADALFWWQFLEENRNLLEPQANPPPVREQPRVPQEETDAAPKDPEPPERSDGPERPTLRAPGENPMQPEEPGPAEMELLGQALIVGALTFPVHRFTAPRSAARRNRWSLLDH